jgi:hypothetical protein
MFLSNSFAPVHAKEFEKPASILLRLASRSLVMVLAPHSPSKRVPSSPLPVNLVLRDTYL